MNLVQIVAWHDGLIALDNYGGLWFGLMDSMILLLRWQRLNTPDSREMGEPR